MAYDAMSFHHTLIVSIEFRHVMYMISKEAFCVRQQPCTLRSEAMCCSIQVSSFLLQAVVKWVSVLISAMDYLHCIASFSKSKICQCCDRNICNEQKFS